MLAKPLFKSNLCALLLVIVFIPALRTPLQDDDQWVEIVSNEAETDFPTSISFEISVRADNVIEEMELYYGVEALTCTDAVTRTVPEDFSPGRILDVTWEWDMYQSGSLPPGATVWWQWKLTDEDGQQFETEIKTLRFEDTLHWWRNIQSQYVDLYYYAGSESFAQYLVDAGDEALIQIEDTFDYRIDGQVQVFVYANTQDMHDAMLYSPAWVGGYAMPEYRTLVAAVTPGDYEWGSSVMAHELTHVVIGHLTFSCVSSLPRWLDEGLAVMIEGDRPDYDQSLEEAIETDSLLRLRQIEGSFSGDSDTALLSYAQSESITRFLIDEYGADALMELLMALKEGTPQDRAFESVYGFDRDRLEALWRSSIGAEPIEVEAGSTGTDATRTPFPTIAPIEEAARPEQTIQPGQDLTLTSQAAEIATDTPSPPAEGAGEAAPASGAARSGGLDNVSILIIIGMAAVVLIGGGIIVYMLTSQRHSSR